MVILSETSQCGGNMAPNLSSHCKRCFLNQVYRRSILSSHPLSSESLNRKRYSFSCTPTNHFKSSCLKNLKSWKYLVTKITVTTITVFYKKTTQNLNLSKLQVHDKELASLLIHPNLDWFSKKVDRMAHFLNYLKLDFLFLTEHRLSETNPHITNLKGYKLFWQVNKLWKCQ